MENFDIFLQKFGVFLQNLLSIFISQKKGFHRNNAYILVCLHSSLVFFAFPFCLQPLKMSVGEFLIIFQKKNSVSQKLTYQNKILVSMNRKYLKNASP